jgi:hypothetical protein
MIEKHHTADLKTQLDAADVNIMRPWPTLSQNRKERGAEYRA